MAQEEGRRKRIEASVKTIIAQLVREEAPGSGKLCNKEIIEKIVDELDKSCTRKIEKSMEKIEKQNRNPNNHRTDIAEAYSVPRMTQMAGKLGTMLRLQWTCELWTSPANIGI